MKIRYSSFSRRIVPVRTRLVLCEKFIAVVLILLLLCFANTCYGSILKCNDYIDESNNNNNIVNDESSSTETKTKKMACQLDVTYEEIASAFNLNCKASENGIKCNFDAERYFVDVSSNSNSNSNNNNEIIKISSPDAFIIHECSTTTMAEASICVHSEVQTTLMKQDGIENMPTIFPPPIQEQEEKRDLAETTHDDGTTTNTLSSVSTEFSIKIGNHDYHEPFEQHYGDLVANAIKAKAHLWKQSPRDYSISHENAVAIACYEIGIAHYSTTIPDKEDDDEYQKAYNDYKGNMKLSVNAFGEAEKLYLKILKEYDHEQYVIQSSLASLYLQWGEIYQSKHYDFENDEGIDGGEEGPKSVNDLSLFYYEKAAMHYLLSIENGKDKVSESYINEIEINLAHACHRVGRSLINSLSDHQVISYDHLTSEGAAIPNNNVLPQIQQIVNIVPKAEKSFNDAIELYRSAIDRASDVDQEVQLKNNLCTTLQDAGTAAASASNYNKAIELQEEGVAICQDILPYLSGATLQFMLQYVGSSMYGLSNHYMQLGRYTDTTASYQRAMGFFEYHELEPSAVATGYQVTDESLDVYEQQLADYLDLKMEISIPDGYVDQNSEQYQPNDIYEGSLHAALGSLHFSRGEILMAIDHFNQAIQLYGSSQGEQDIDRSIADVKVSLAAAHFKNGEYRSSAENHKEAMEIYKEVIGEGKNPLLESLTEKLGAITEASDLLSGSDILDDLLGSDVVQELLASLDVEDLTATLENLSNKKSKNGKEDENGRIGQAEAEDKKSKKSQVHEELFDMENLRQILLNMTSSKEEL